MRIFRSFLSRMRSLFKHSQVEADLNDEFQDYIEHQMERHMSAGLQPAEARLATFRDIGGMEQAKEKCRDARGTRWVNDAIQDTRHTLRILAKSPSFTAVVLGCLAIVLAIR